MEVIIQLFGTKTVENLSKIKKEINILLDLPEIKPRTNNAKDIFISKNQEISFYYGNFRGKIKKLCLFN